LCDLWKTPEGARLLQQALSALQEVGSSSGLQAQSEHAPYSVRRLTPVECSRLQAFPDEWVHTHNDPPFNDPCSRCPDGRRYAALGDAVTVNVIEWIGRRIKQCAA
jgi:site-specific DNA-cytosine methylase